MAKIERAGVKQRKGTPPKQNVTVTKPTIVGTKPGVPKNIRGVFFGPPKTGKTTAACGTAGQRTLLIEFDPDGEATETLVGRDDITVVKPRNRTDIDTLLKQLHAGAVEDFDWIVLDSLTFLFDLLAGREINAVWLDNKDVRRSYGRGGAGVNQILHDLLMLDVNLILTAHLEKESEEDAISVEQELGESEVKVAVTPMVWKYIGPAVSFVGRSFKKKVYEREGKKRNSRTMFGVSFNDGERSPAGSRLRMAGEYEVTPTWLSELATELKGSD